MNSFFNRQVGKKVTQLLKRQTCNWKQHI